MRTALKITSTALAGVALAASLAAPAEAVSAYRDINYSGSAVGGTDRPNFDYTTMNDDTSSVQTYGLWVRFYEDTGYTGRSFTTNQNWNDLRSLHIAWGMDWNDRISSWDTYPYYGG